MRCMLLCTLEAVVRLCAGAAGDRGGCALSTGSAGGVLEAVDSVFCLLCSVCWSSWR